MADTGLPSLPPKSLAPTERQRLAKLKEHTIRLIPEVQALYDNEVLFEAFQEGKRGQLRLANRHLAYYLWKLRDVLRELNDLVHLLEFVDARTIKRHRGPNPQYGGVFDLVTECYFILRRYRLQNFDSGLLKAARN